MILTPEEGLRRFLDQQLLARLRSGQGLGGFSSRREGTTIITSNGRYDAREVSGVRNLKP